MILRCKCKNDYQDERYGANYRVHNPIQVSGTQSPRYRCTVCLSERGKSEETKLPRTKGQK
jgi:hypothetical protein